MRVGVTLAFAAPAVAGPIKSATVKTHPSQDEVTAVEGASASLLRHPDSLFVSLDTNGLPPGHVHTLWLVVINDPAARYDEAAVETGQKKAPEDCDSRDVVCRETIDDDEALYCSYDFVEEGGDLVDSARDLAPVLQGQSTIDRSSDRLRTAPITSRRVCRDRGRAARHPWHRGADGA